MCEIKCAQSYLKAKEKRKTPNNPPLPHLHGDTGITGV